MELQVSMQLWKFWPSIICREEEEKKKKHAYADRVTELLGKSKGSGICFYIQISQYFVNIAT